MAQKVEVVLTCDLDEEVTPAAETVVFGYDGQSYEFELCAAHLDEFHKVMQGFVGAARPSGRRPAAAHASARPARASANPSELAEIRQWARTNGYEVNDRGRIPSQLRAAFEAAQR